MEERESEEVRESRRLGEREGYNLHCFSCSHYLKKIRRKRMKNMAGKIVVRIWGMMRLREEGDFNESM